MVTQKGLQEFLNEVLLMFHQEVIEEVVQKVSLLVHFPQKVYREVLQKFLQVALR